MKRPTAWIRLSVGIGDHPDIIGLPTHAARWAFIVLLTKAKQQPEPGLFRTDELVGHVLGRGLTQTLPALVQAGLIDHREEGGYVIRNWERWQTPNRVDHTNAERQRRHREREKTRSNATVTPVTPEAAVTPSNGGPPKGSNAVTPPAVNGAAVTAERQMTSSEARQLFAPSLPIRGKRTASWCADLDLHRSQHRIDQGIRVCPDCSSLGVAI